MNAADTHSYWLEGDREGFIEHVVAARKTARGYELPIFTASRWFNLMGIVLNSDGDVWFHRDGDDLWWTRTTDAPATIDETPTASPHDERGAYEAHKPTEPWRNVDARGVRLSWASLHPKARDFLSTEATLQKLSPDYEAYAYALIEGRDLDSWHQTEFWRAASARRKANHERHLTPIEQSANEMAYRAQATAKAADGRAVERTAKVKEFGFDGVPDAARYILALLEAQEGLCALTELPLEYHGVVDDPAMTCSLDRIDSDGDYAPGNLQVVCQFANRWKSDGTDAEFKRLIAVVRSG